jgi:adenylate kinase
VIPSAYPGTQLTGPPPQIIILEPPGAGKGTQAVRLAERLGLVHINPGRILRQAVQRDSAASHRIRAAMAAGGLVPDEIIDRVVREQLEALSPEQGFVLDGYPT